MDIKIQKQFYGQLVIGPPGSGKTTYCQKMMEFYEELGRNCALINLDPANENMNNKAEIDIMSLIKLEDAMDYLVSQKINNADLYTNAYTNIFC